PREFQAESARVLRGGARPRHQRGLIMLKPPSAAFSRNIGILTVEEQQRLADSTVAIAGLGGVGGSVLILLARMGVGRFRLAAFDRFEEVNINRQYGSSTTTIGEPKVEVLAREVRAINPAAD